MPTAPRTLLIRVATENPSLRKTLLPIVASTTREAVNIPPDVDRYFKETKEQSPSYDDAKAWAVAWSRYCAYKNPGSDHCKQDSYFPGKKKSASVSDWSKGAGGMMTRQFDTLDGRVLGTLHADAYSSKANWRPNQLVPDFVKPQVVARGRDVATLMSEADAWAEKNLRGMTRLGSEDAALLAKVAKLAEDRPEFRDRLLPLLQDKTAAPVEDSPKQAQTDEDPMWARYSSGGLLDE